ncbi:LysR family transcriptional regulator [Bradyrhizobium sp. LjRoot220]|uniref:LysR family transcriptional regulator n=1 Tax=Bradyrhizobium sp. LjRoot220 TaxID=3342284 RepID=UPI003ED15CB8
MTTILEKTAGLVAFVRTVDSGSFSNASRAIGSSASAVSKSVARLERRLGVRLLQRSTRTLSLTTEGAAYYERVAPLLRAIEDAEDVVQMAASARGLLRVTAPVFIGRMLVGEWSQAFLARHPHVKLELSVSDRHADLIREGFDVALRIGDLADTDLTARKLADLPMAMIASPGYIAARGAPRMIEELRKHACLRYLLAGKPYPFAFADGTTITPESVLDSDDGITLYHAALHGAGIAQVLRFGVEDDFAAGRLVEILPDVAMPSVPMHVVHAFDRQLPVRARLFVDFLVERFIRIGK